MTHQEKKQCRDDRWTIQMTVSYATWPHSIVSQRCRSYAILKLGRTKQVTPQLTPLQTWHTRLVPSVIIKLPVWLQLCERGRVAQSDRASDF